MSTRITLDAHPLLDAGIFTTEFVSPLAERVTPEWLVGFLAADAEAPLRRSDEVRAAVRNLLRHGGHKPTGRGKPASEYLVRAAADGALASINLAVDVCNAVSLHSGLPVSVVDLTRSTDPFRIGVAGPEDRYVFNASGQEIALRGLLCLFDADGPCANGVKDAQRTKTTPETTRTLTVIWGTQDLPGRTEATVAWYRQLLADLDAPTTVLEPDH